MPTDGKRTVAAEEGLLAPIDLNSLPEGEFKDGRRIPAHKDFLGQWVVHGKHYDVPNINGATFVAFDKTKYLHSDSQPTKMADFFDLKRFPGKRGVHKETMMTFLEKALYADGVPAEEIYKVLATKAGLDRAFTKVDMLKGHIIWWSAGAQAPQLLADHKVVMTTAWNGRIGAAIMNDNMPFGQIWDGMVSHMNYFVIPAKSKNRKEALNFIAFATSTHPLANATKCINYGPLRTSSQDWVPPKIRPMLPSSHLDHSITFNTQFWGNHSDAIRNRWNNFVVKSWNYAEQGTIKSGRLSKK